MSLNRSLSKNQKREMAVARLLLEAQTLLAEAVHDAKMQGLTAAQIARELGRDRSFVTRRTRDATNITLRTLAELLYETGGRVSLERHKINAGGHNARNIQGTFVVGTTPAQTRLATRPTAVSHLSTRTADLYDKTMVIAA